MKKSVVVDKVPSAQNIIKDVCGFCGKQIDDDDYEQQYIASCELCNQTCVIHGRNTCAGTLYSQTEMYKTKPDLELEVFNGLKSVGLYCIHCREECFYCYDKVDNPSHSFGKYDIHLHSLHDANKNFVTNTMSFLFQRCKFNP